VKRRGRRDEQLLDNLKAKRKSWKMKQDALERRPAKLASKEAMDLLQDRLH
jgi:hypothetical protein